MDIYLDNNATTRPLQQVLESVRRSFEDGWGNPSSPHRYGDRARRLISRARDSVAALVGALPEEVIFTSGGTEANNTVLSGVAQSLPESRRTILLSRVEHSSVMECAPRLERLGFKILWLDVGHDGRVALESMASHLRSGSVGLASIQWANSETGVLQDVEAIGKLCADHDTLFHCDAAQAVGKCPIAFRSLPIDYLTFTAHKLHGLKGAGAIISSKPLPPLLLGGGQEQGQRPGTENVPAIVGFGVAAEIRNADLSASINALRMMRDTFEDRLKELLPACSVNGDSVNRVANTSNIFFPGIIGEAMSMHLDAGGIAVSQTSACIQSRPEPSPVLTAMGLSEDDAYACLRFSFSVLNNHAEAVDAANFVYEVYEEMNSRSRNLGLRGKIEPSTITL